MKRLTSVGITLGCAAAYAVLFVLPYYVNDLDRFPLEEVASRYHDPKDLGPYDIALGGFVFRLGGLMTLVFGPAVALGALAWALVRLWGDRSNHDLRGRAALLMAVAGALGILIWLLSPFGAALRQWWLD